MSRILVTREFAEPLAGMLTARGFEVLHVPLVVLEPTHASPPASSPTAVVVTSKAVARFVPGLRRYIGAARVVAVGSATADSLVSIGVEVGDVGTQGGLDALTRLQQKPGDVAWYVGAEKPSTQFAMALDQQHIARWPVYRNIRPEGPSSELVDLEFDGIAFTSGSAVQAFVADRGIPNCPVFVLGHTTAEVAKGLGVTVSAIADHASLAKLADAVADQF